MAIDIGNILTDFADAIISTLQANEQSNWELGDDERYFNENQTVLITLPICCVVATDLWPHKTLSPVSKRMGMKAMVKYIKAVPDDQIRTNEIQQVIAEMVQIIEQNKTLGGFCEALTEVTAMGTEVYSMHESDDLAGEGTVEVIGFKEIDVTNS